MIYQITDDYGFIKEFQADNNQEFFNTVIDILIDYQVVKGCAMISQRIEKLHMEFFKTLNVNALDTIKSLQGKLQFCLYLYVKVGDTFYTCGSGGLFNSVDINRIDQIYDHLGKVADQAERVLRFNQAFFKGNTE
jgi:hypothetical protein